MMRLVWFAPLLSLLLCSCSLIPMEPYRKTIYFDIVPSETELHRGVGYSLLSVTSSMPFSDRMLFRLGKDKMEFDEYHRWVASPETLVKRYIETSFSYSSTAPSLQVRILRFELDKPELNATCEIQVLYTGATENAIHVFRTSETVKSRSEASVDFAEAMHLAVAQAVTKLASQLQTGK